MKNLKRCLKKEKDAKPVVEFGYRVAGFCRDIQYVARDLVNREVFEFEEDLLGVVKKVEKFRDDIRKAIVGISMKGSEMIL